MSGVAPALVAAVGFAVFQLTTTRALGRVEVVRGTATLFAVAASVLVVVAGLTGELAVLVDAPARAIAWFAAAGLVHFLVGWTFLGTSQVAMGAARTGIVTASVPLFGALVAVVALGERLGGLQWVALAVVVAGVALVALARRSGEGVRGRDGAASVSQRSRRRGGGVAALATAACWSLSPVLIRRGLAIVPSPVIGASVGMGASALVAGARVLARTVRVRRGGVRGPGARPVGAWRSALPLLTLAGTVVAMAIWLQWSAFEVAPVAVVLALLQLTPLLVVLVSVVGGTERYVGLRGAGRLWGGTLATIVGSLVLVLADRG